jgi:probable rRNA maturation factor
MSGTTKRKRAPATEAAVTVQVASRAAATPPPARFRRWARAALARNAKITLRIVGTREARALNKRYRRRDYATNVLTFVYADERPLAGDIALCAPVVRREARAQNISMAAHYAHLTVHGVLHLQGYDHVRARDAERMEKLEVRILKKLGYRNPYRDPGAAATKVKR